MQRIIYPLRERASKTTGGGLFAGKRPGVSHGVSHSMPPGGIEFLIPEEYSVQHSSIFSHPVDYASSFYC